MSKLSIVIRKVENGFTIRTSKGFWHKTKIYIANDIEGIQKTVNTIIGLWKQ